MANNPRSMKRFLNEYSIMQASALLTLDRHSPESLKIWVIIMNRWPILAQYLSNHPEQVEIIREGNIDTTDDELSKLSLDNNVKSLINGDHYLGIPKLTADDIRKYSKLRPYRKIS